MAPLRTIAVLSSLALASAVRRNTDSDEGWETQLAAGKAQEAAAAATPRPQLQLFAASFNGANHQYEAAQTAELLATLVGGHDEPGREADIVFLGLQEFSESRVSLADHACEAALWPGLTERAGQQLAGDLRHAAAAPSHLHGLKAELAAHLAGFHGRLGAETNAFTQRFSPVDHDFHHHLSRNSHILRFEEQSRLLKHAVDGHVEGIIANVEDYKAEVSDRKFDGFRSQAQHVQHVAQNYDQAAIESRLAPIEEWTAGAMSSITALQAGYPNMALSDAGRSEMSAFLSSVDNVAGLRQSLLDRQHMDEVSRSVSALNHSITTQVEEAEADMQRLLLEDLSGITRYTTKLMEDVRRIDFDRHINIARAASEGTEDRQARIMATANLWASESREAVSSLLQPGALDLTAAHLDVKSKTEAWNSGWRCHSGSHFDTTLHAFINPWSRWRIEQIDYESHACRKASRGLGCTLNNNVGWECGKVVNMQVFEARRDDATIRVCAMNTHMSFSNTAEERMSSISAALAESTAANCDSLVFLGDFNSRPHCHVSSEVDEVLPPFERLDPATNSSLNYLLEEFCRGDSCAIAGPKRHWDELTQMMESTEQLACYESDTASPAGWRLNSVENPIPATGLREAGPVNFAPTYKMKSPERAARLGHYHRCLPGEPTCFANSDSKGKHNPAWTDRILLKSSDRVSVSTREYSRRPVTPEYHTDHIPVVARVTVEAV